jgi:hypothetical protein
MRRFGAVCHSDGTLGSVSASGVPATSAGRNDAQTSGQNDHHVTVIQADINPCTGDTGTLTHTYNDADPVPAPVNISRLRLHDEG